jgi:hypothetical protein
MDNKDDWNPLGLLIIIIEIKLLYYISTSVLKLQLMPLKSHPCVTYNHGKYSCPGS